MKITLNLTEDQLLLLKVQLTNLQNACEATIKFPNRMSPVSNVEKKLADAKCILSQLPWE